MKKDLTEIVFILDRSGSMDALTADTIGGYNAFLETQRQTVGEAKVTTILFDDKYEILHDGLDIRQVRPITSKEYFARGSTALLDAVGMTINDVGARLNGIVEGERPEKVIVVIITDGKENASKEFSYKKIQRMITHQKGIYGWEFLFIGANIDAVREAQNIGINANRAANYAATEMGTQALYNTVAQSIVRFRDCGKITDNLQSEIDKSGGKNKLIN